MSKESMHFGKEKRKEFEIEAPEEIEWRNVTPKDDEESIERYVENVPDIVVDEYKKYIDKHKEDDELVKRYPHDYHRSISVLPIVGKDGKRYLRTVSTNEGKTKEFLDFLKEGRFHFENEIIEGVNREEVKKELMKKAKEKAFWDRIRKEKEDRR